MKRYMWIVVGLVLTAIIATIAVRMTSDAIAVIVGIILGMVATLPTSLILLYLLRQQHAQQVDLRQQQNTSHHPPVVVVNTPAGHAGYGIASANPQSYLPSAIGERSFKVVGQEASSPDSDRSFSFNSIFDEVT